MPPPELSISSDYVERLLAKIRGVQGKVGEAVPDPASNGADDGMTDALQDHVDDPQRQEARAEIQGLNERQRAELVALLWIGRGDVEPEDWEDTIAMARERATSPAGDYLLSQPLVAEYIVEGMERLGLEFAATEMAPEAPNA